jgi:hypothetical protein
MKKSVLALMALVAASSAQASIIYVFQSVTPVGGGSFDWKYVAQLSADQKINTAVSPAFAVVYDFLGATSVTTSGVAAGLGVNSFLESTTAPQPFSQNVTDLAAIPNVHSTITGSLTPSVLTNIYTVDIFSTSSGLSQQLLTESAQAEKNAPGDPANGSATGNSALITGPSAVPEPASSAIMGLGLLGLGMLGSRRKRS